MPLATWWRGDRLPPLIPLAGFHTGACEETNLLSRLCDLEEGEIRRRRQEGHRAYVGRLAGEAVAYGWVATRRAGIGELRLDFRLPPRHRYLWDFATLPPQRGRGIYPRLLQAILQQEVVEADYFWIIRAPENGASGAGIDRAGFTPAGWLSLMAGGRSALLPWGDGRRAAAGAALLGVPLLQDGLFPCWHCGGAAYPPAAGAAACTFRPIPARRFEDCACASLPRRAEVESLAGP